jgi:hypothetical protein
MDDPAATDASERFKGIIKWSNPYISWQLKAFAKYFFKQAPFIFAINGHPLNQVAYIQTPMSRQMGFLKSMGMNYYRIDIGTDAVGTIREEKRFNELIQTANANNIRILPNIFLAGLDFNADAATNYNVGKILGKGFAAKYGRHFDYYELGNEYDLKLKPSTADGRFIESYDKAKFDRFAAFIKGLTLGIKSEDPTAKTMINACGWHYGFYQLIKQANIDMDVIANHLYTKSVNQSSAYVEIVKEVAKIFDNKKPVFITELNKEDGDILYVLRDGTLQNQDEIVNDFIAKLKAVPLVKAIFVYELLDQPELIHPKERERHMGMIKWNTPYSSWSYKPVANTMVSLAQ